MKLFDLLGYSTDAAYPLQSKTSVGPFALVVVGTPPPTTSKIYYGATNITSIYYGNIPAASIYYGSIKVF